MASDPKGGGLSQPAKGTAIGLAIAAAVAIAAPFTAPREGLATRPYLDPVHIRTVCYGDTAVTMRIYTADECMVLLKARQQRDYAPRVLACAPGLAGKRLTYALAASIDAAYNAGPAAFCRSPMARAFNATLWRKGCEAFVGWYETGRVNGRVVRFTGLVRRRLAERGLCLTDLPGRVS